MAQKCVVSNAARFYQREIRFSFLWKRVWLPSLMAVAIGSLVSQIAFAEQKNISSNEDNFPVAQQLQREWSIPLSLTAEPPVLDDKSVYVLSKDCEVQCIDQATGKVRWQVSLSNYLLPSPLENSKARTGSFPNSFLGSRVYPQIPAPVADSTAVYVPLSDRSSGHLFAINKQTGAVLWQFTSKRDAKNLHGMILSQPLIAGDKVLVRTNGSLAAVDIKTGTMIWSSFIGNAEASVLRTTSQPICDDQNIYLSPDLGTIYAFRLKDGLQVWHLSPNPDSEKVIGSVVKRSISLNRCSPIIVDGHLIAADGTGHVYCVSIANHRLLWSADTKQIWQLKSVEGRIYAAGHSGFMELDPETGKLLRLLPLPGGAFSFLINRSYALIATNPYSLPGCETVDLKAWQYTRPIQDVRIRFGMASEGNSLVIGEEKTGENGTNTSFLTAFSSKSPDKP